MTPPPHSCPVPRYVHALTSRAPTIRHSKAAIRRRNPEGCGRCQFSYLGVPARRLNWYMDPRRWLRPFVVPTAPFVIPRYGGGNPRTNIPRKNVNRDTITYVHTATPLRLSGESTPQTPIRRRNPEGCGQCQFSYLGVPAPAGMRDCYESMSRTPIRDRPLRARLSPLISSFQRKLESRRGGEE